MKVLVTGAGKNGFLGYHVRKAFKDTDLDVKFIGSEYDLTSYDRTWDIIFNYEPNVILHCAAACGGILANKKSPADFITKNTQMNINIYKAGLEYMQCSKDELYIYTLGSVCSYPVNCKVPFKEDDLFKGYPESTNAPYGIAKRNLFVMGNAYRDQYGIKGAHLIPGNMFGEKDHFDLINSHVIPALITKFLNPEKCSITQLHEGSTPAVPIWGTGTATREFLYAGDCAKAIVKAVTSKLNTPLPINIGTGRDISIKELVHLIIKLTGYKGGIIFTGEVSDGQPKRRLDVSRAKELLGFEAEINLEEGLVRTIKWYKKNIHLIN